MVNPSVAVNELLDLLAKLRAEEDGIAKEIEERLTEVRRKIAAVQVTLDLLGQPGGGNGSSPTNGWAQKLRDLTQVKALMRIAEENGGILRTNEARRIFLAIGLSKGKPKYLGPHIFHLVMNSGRFERIAPGTYKLIPESVEPMSLI